MKYIQKNTGQVIETECIIHSNNWILVEDKPKTQSKRKNVKKSGDK